jgi:hypothetical protein
MLKTSKNEINVFEMISIVNLDKTKLAYCAEVNSRSREKFAKVRCLNIFVRSRAVHLSQYLLQSLPHSSQNIPPTTNNSSWRNCTLVMQIFKRLLIIYRTH